MNKYINYRFKDLIVAVALILIGASPVHSEPALLVASGRTLENVRVEVLSVEEEGQSARVRFSGQGCHYCDDTYRIDQTTELFTKDYQGSADIKLLKNMVFMRGSARVVLADKWVQEVRYVAREE